MNIVFLDCTQNLGLQFSAGNTKVQMLAAGLAAQDDTVSVINGIAGTDKVKQHISVSMPNFEQVITYPVGIGWQILPLSNMGYFISDLKKLRKPGVKNILMLENPYIHIYWLYLLVGKVLGYKIVVISHEWSPSIKRKYWVQNVSAHLYAKTFGYGIHGILPISEYIIQRIKKFRKPYLKTPVLAKFPKVPDSTGTKGDFFLYCVYAAYFRVIALLIESYKQYASSVESPLKLRLVLSGTEAHIKKVRDYIEALGLTDKIVILSRLPYVELLNNYQSARALIIPLDPSYEQDEARFSQKIAEYLSSGSPIISNNVGEIRNYFTDSEDIILAEYSTYGFCEAFKWIHNNPEKSKEIGLQGFKLGAQNFNALTFGKELHKFLSII